MKPTPRAIFLALFAASAGLIAGGLFLQHVKHLEPCAMCILQRYAFVLIGVTSLLAALHNPRKKGTRLYALALMLLTLTGGGIAARQAWMQRFPSQEMECGPGLDYMLQSFPMADALPRIFPRSNGPCSVAPSPSGRWLGL